jgi:hypothetical protein
LLNSRRNTSRKTDTLDLELTTARGSWRSRVCILIQTQNLHFYLMWSTMLRLALQVFNITLIFRKSFQGHKQLLWLSHKNNVTESNSASLRRHPQGTTRQTSHSGGASWRNWASSLRRDVLSM